MFRCQLAHLAPADYRPRAERANLLRDILIKPFLPADYMHPHGGDSGESLNISYIQTEESTKFYQSLAACVGNEGDILMNWNELVKQKITNLREQKRADAETTHEIYTILADR